MTRSEVSSLTSPRVSAFSARETVPGCTFAARATSRRVTDVERTAGIMHSFAARIDRRCRPGGAEHQLLPRRAPRGPGASRLPPARRAARHAAAREPGDPRARAGRAALLQPQLGRGLPQRRARAPHQGAVPGLRLADDRLPLLRVPAVSPGRRARAVGGPVLGAARVRGVRALRRAPEGGARVHEHDRVEPARRRRRAVRAPARALHRRADRRARLLHLDHVRPAAVDQDARDRPRRGPRPRPRRPRAVGHRRGGRHVSRIEPVSPADAVRARLPAALAAYAETRATVLEAGVVDRALKELCARYLAEEDEVVAHADDPARFDERERAALAWTHAVAWNSDLADAALWERLHACFTEPELVELGYAIAFSLGQQHWVATPGLTDG